MNARQETPNERPKMKNFRLTAKQQRRVRAQNIIKGLDKLFMVKKAVFA